MINIVLYEPEIPQNCGNIIRTCVGTASMLHLIEPLGFKVDDKSLKRSAVNYIEHLQMKVYPNWEAFLKENDGDFYFLTRYGKNPHTYFDYTKSKKDIYLIFGKESTGIPKEILKNHLDCCLRIPTTSNVRSLNLANCVALVTYEVLRQLDYPGLLFEEPHKGVDYLEK